MRKCGFFHTKNAAGLVAFILLMILTAKDIRAVDTLPSEEYANSWESRKSLPVETDSISSWPKGPENGTESAILMEADTGAILYAKNIDERLYPASTTKMMTALLVVENCQMDETVTFSDEAIDNTEWGSSRIGIKKGEQLTVEQSLYGLLLGSANEVAYGLAEHVGGDLSSFVDMMNERAAALGCTNTHFANASGLPDPEHYVSALDMAKIAREFFSNETLCMISGSDRYVIPKTNITDEERPLENHHKMIKGKKYEYDGIVGGKTGFTTDARQTLVTCAQREGMKLICVVMKDESPHQFTDTADLFDYGFASFQKLNVAENENRYNIRSASFFHTKIDILGSSKDILSLNKRGSIVIPKGMSFEEATVTVDLDPGVEGAVAKLDYFVGSNRVGGTTLDYASGKKLFEFANIITDSTGEQPETYTPDHKTVFVTVSDVVKKLFIIVGVLFFVIFAIALILRFIRSAQRAKMKKRKRYKKRSENRRYNYKKRSENKRRKEPGEQLTPRNMYMEPVYKELQKRSADASGRKDEEFFDEDIYEDEDEYYDEEQMIKDFPAMEGYGIELLPLDHPNRWSD